jgi:hypothetical protein
MAVGIFGHPRPHHRGRLGVLRLQLPQAAAHNVLALLHPILLLVDLARGGVGPLRRQRLAVGRRLRGRAYARLAAIWRDGVRPDGEAEAERFLRGLADREAAEGAPLQAVLSRLPPGLA